MRHATTRHKDSRARSSFRAYFTHKAQHSIMFSVARPPSDVSLYRVCISFPVSLHRLNDLIELCVLRVPASQPGTL